MSDAAISELGPRGPESLANCGQALAALLEAYGVELVFGIPGVHSLELYRGLAGSGIRHVLTRHEQGAAFMADGYARLSGKPGVCCLITGPGVTNAATAIGEAYADSIPLLAISAVNARHHLGKGWGHLHEISDQRALTAPITAFSATALSPADLPDLMARAFTVFESGRPRPVHIELPIDLQELPAEGDWRVRRPAGPPAPQPAAVESALALLRGARRPVILFGGGARDCGPALQRLAERLDAPLLASIAGKGLVPDDSSRCAGFVLWSRFGRDLVAEADVLLVVGSEMAPTDSLQDSLEISGRIIRVDLDPAKMSDLYPAEVALLADAGSTLAALLEGLGDGPPPARAEGAVETVEALRRGLRGELGEAEREHERILNSLRAVLPDEAAVFADMTQIAYSANLLFPVRSQGGWNYPAGFGTLGYAVPAAVGGALAAPERPVVALVGDHGLLYTGQELATAVEQRLPIAIVLWNNNRLGQIRDEMLQKGIPPLGVDLHSPDFCALAEAYGCRSRRPESLEAFRADLAEALSQKDGPTLIELREGLADRT